MTETVKSLNYTKNVLQTIPNNDTMEVVTQTNAVKPVRIGRFYLSESKCTVSARILHGFKTCRGCFSLQNPTKGAEIAG